MELTLTYRDDLPAEKERNHRSEEKQRIRLHFHEQLAELWRSNPRLKQAELMAPTWALKDKRIVLGDAYMAFSHCQVETCGFRALPLITRHNGLVCELSIDFLRPGEPGEVLKAGGGDLDNRLKVLFDALHMPLAPNEVPGSMFGQGGSRLYSLMEDDSLISKLTIDSRQLLTSARSPNYVELQIKATVRVLRAHAGTSAL